MKDASVSHRVLDVAACIFEPVESVGIITVNDVRPLLQIQTDATKTPTVSAISAVKRHRNQTDSMKNLLAS